MAGLSSRPFIPAGSKHSHHATTKTSKVSEGDRRKLTDRTEKTSSRTDAFPSTSHGLPRMPSASGSTSALAPDLASMAQAQDRLELIKCDADNMNAKLQSVQETISSSKDDLIQLRSLISSLERLSGSKNVDHADLKCSLLKTQIEGLSETAKILPHYYPSKVLFVEAVMALKEALSCHDYVNVVDCERTELLRKHEKLRDEMRLLADENDRLKRRHRKDRKTIAELLERLGQSGHNYTQDPATLNSGCSPKVLSSCSGHSVDGGGRHSHVDTRASQTAQQNSLLAYKEEDLQMIEMLRQVKAVLREGTSEAGGGDATVLPGHLHSTENASKLSRDYEELVRRLEDVVKPTGSAGQDKEDGVSVMDGYFRIFEKNIALLEQELSNESGRNERKNKSYNHNNNSISESGNQT